MPAFDQCHDQITRALQKDGWQIEDAPFRIILPPRIGYIDVRLSRGSNGTYEQMMLVEIKCFPDEDSTTRELYTSLGQYLVYRAMVSELGIPYPLYLSVPEHIFDKIFDASVMYVINESKIKVVVVNLDMEVIVKWIR